MKKSVFIPLLFAWAVFLVCIGTFGGHDGMKVAGNAAWISVLLLFIFGDEIIKR